MHIRENDLELYASDELPPGFMLTVEFHLSACEPCRAKLSKAMIRLIQNAQAKMQSKRSDVAERPAI